jgi:parvulin-like peptidyl-prolyl isomerase
VLLGVAALAVSGCATFTDADVAVRVGDDQLSEDQLDELVRERLGDTTVDTAPMTVVNEIITTYVLDRALRADLAALGSPLPDVEGDVTVDSLTSSANLAFSAWQQTPPDPSLGASLRNRYELGPVESDITCTAHILVEDEAAARDVLARLDLGEDFGELAAELSIDPGSSDDGGVLPCTTTSTFSQQYIPEYVAGALDAEIGEPTAPVESQFGFHVILVRPFDELTADELDQLLTIPQIRFDLAAADLDVYVNPRYGSFEGARGVVPLG